MIELVISGVVVLGFGGYVYKQKRSSSDRFNGYVSVWETNLVSFMQNNGLTSDEIELYNKTHIKKKFDEISLRLMLQTIIGWKI